MTATAMKTCKTNGVLFRNRQIHNIVGQISSSYVFGRHCGRHWQTPVFGLRGGACSAPFRVGSSPSPADLTNTAMGGIVNSDVCWLDELGWFVHSFVHWFVNI